MGISEVHLKVMRDPARMFPSPANPDAVRSATVWHCKYKSLEPLIELRNLEELVIASFPDESFEFLGRLEKPRFLWIMHMPKISDVGPLARLTQLTSLSLSTLPSWDASRKTTTIQSLQPLTAIPELAHLGLLGICLTNCSAPSRSAHPSRRPGSRNTLKPK
jgi:hypothetical protein